MDVRESLLKATVKLFGEVGSRGATTRRIAQEAGVNEVTLFRHFPNKEALIAEALRVSGEHGPAKHLPDRPVNPAAELTAWCRDHYKNLYKLRSLIRTSMGEYEEHPEQCARAMRVSVVIANELTDYLLQLKATGLAAGDWDAHAASAMLMNAIFGDALGRDTMPERYPYPMRDAVEKYVHLFLNAIGAKS